MASLRLTTLAVFTSTCLLVGVIAAQDGPVPPKPSEGPASLVPKDSDSPVSSSQPAAAAPAASSTEPPKTQTSSPSAATSSAATTEAPTTEAPTTEAAKTQTSPIATPSPTAKPAASKTPAGPVLPPKSAAKPKAAATPKLVSAAKEERLRKLLPKIDDPAVAAILSDKRTIFYTDEEMPKAYQFYNGAFPGLHSVNYNISANNSEPFGNGNREFPWSTPAGAHRCENVFTFRFLHLPVDKAGKTRPIVYEASPQGGHSWVYPVGAVLGEVLVETSPKGYGYAFELRVRRRERSDWDSDAYRPFPTTDDLAVKLRELEPAWKTKKNVFSLLRHLEKPLALKTDTLADTQPQGPTFRSTMGVDVLPALNDDALVAKLLKSTTFTSAKDTYWRVSSKKSSIVAAAPTTEAAFHIVPRHYDAGFIEVDKVSCMRCHETTNQDVDNFDGGRDWYGRVRGSDGVFSFHPFEPSSMSYNGFSSQPAMRASFTRTGLIERFSKALHPRTIYNRIRNLVY